MASLSELQNLFSRYRARQAVETAEAIAENIFGRRSETEFDPIDSKEIALLDQAEDWDLRPNGRTSNLLKSVVAERIKSVFLQEMERYLSDHGLSRADGDFYNAETRDAYHDAIFASAGLFLADDVGDKAIKLEVKDGELFVSLPGAYFHFILAPSAPLKGVVPAELFGANIAAVLFENDCEKALVPQRYDLDVSCGKEDCLITSDDTPINIGMPWCLSVQLPLQKNTSLTLGRTTLTPDMLEDLLEDEVLELSFQEEGINRPQKITVDLLLTDDLSNNNQVQAQMIQNNSGGERFDMTDGPIFKATSVEGLGWDEKEGFRNRVEFSLFPESIYRLTFKVSDRNVELDAVLIVDAAGTAHFEPK